MLYSLDISTIQYLQVISIFFVKWREHDFLTVLYSEVNKGVRTFLGRYKIAEQ